MLLCFLPLLVSTFTEALRSMFTSMFTLAASSAAQSLRLLAFRNCPLQKIAPPLSVQLVWQVWVVVVVQLSNSVLWQSSWHFVFAVAVQRPTQAVEHFVLQSWSLSLLLHFSSHFPPQVCEHETLQCASPDVSHSALQSPPHSPPHNPFELGLLCDSQSVSQLVWQSFVQ